MGRRGELYSSIKAQIGTDWGSKHVLSPEALPGLLSGLQGEGKGGAPGGGGRGFLQLGQKLSSGSRAQRQM